MGFYVWSLFCNTVLSVLSSFAIILLRKKEAGYFTFIVLLLSRDYKCSVFLPLGDVGCSVACDGIYMSYSFSFRLKLSVLIMQIIELLNTEQDQRQTKEQTQIQESNKSIANNSFSLP